MCFRERRSSELIGGLRFFGALLALRPTSVDAAGARNVEGCS
jgi:hypothetical protein